MLKHISKLTAFYILLIITAISLTLNILGIFGKISLRTLKNETEIPITKEVIHEHDVKVVYVDRNKEIPVFLDQEGNEWKIFKCTGYSLNDMANQGTNNVVAMGLNAEKFDSIPIIAVDPKVIPLHSIVEIEGMGAFNALDTGGAIKGNRIDILFDSKLEAKKFGIQYKLVRVINKGE